MKFYLLIITLLFVSVIKADSEEKKEPIVDRLTNVNTKELWNALGSGTTALLNLAAICYISSIFVESLTYENPKNDITIDLSQRLAFSAILTTTLTLLEGSYEKLQNFRVALKRFINSFVQKTNV